MKSIQAWTGPWGSNSLKLDEFLDKYVHEDGKVVSCAHLPSLAPPEDMPGIIFLSETEKLLGL
jgi:hypothetical protein